MEIFGTLGLLIRRIALLHQTGRTTPLMQAFFSQINFPRSETWAKQLIFDQFSFLKSPFFKTLLCVIFFHFLLILRYDIGNIQIVFSCFHCCIECDILKPFYWYFYHLVATLVLKSKKFGKNSTLLFHYWRARRKEHYTFIKEAWFALAFIFGQKACMSTSCIVSESLKAWYIYIMADWLL